MIEQNFVVGAFQCNCRLLACPITGEAVLVDPGDEPLKLIEGLKNAKTRDGKSIRVKYLLHTHGHLDHVGATRKVYESLAEKPKLSIHKADEPLYQALQTQGSYFGFQYDEPLPVTHYLEHEEEFDVGSLKFSVIHTPGHSPGSVCFRLHEDKTLGSKESLYSGDTLFKGSVGRSDLWGGNGDLLIRSIRERLMTLDRETRICPGHGKDSTVEIEKKTNPFLV